MRSTSTTDGARFAAHLNDGRSAARIDAVAVLREDGVAVLSAEDGAPLALWHYADLGIFQVRRGDPVRLSSRSAPDARLTIPDPSVLPRLHSLMQVPARRRGPGWSSHAVLGAAAVAAILLLGWLTYAAIPLAARPLARMVPEDWERAWGAGIVESLAPARKTCATADGQAALDRLVADLARAGEVTQSFEIRVADLPGVNAFAAPGGHIVLLRGLVADARTPEELAGVVAHEMAHGLERHATAGVIRGVGVGLLAAWLTGDPSGLLAGAGSMLVGLSYSRADEAEADARAVALLTRAGFGTEGLRSFFQRLAETQGEQVELLSSHPLPTERAAAVPAQPGRAAFSPAEWGAVKRICG